MSSFLHSGDIGDIIYSLPVVRRLGGGTYYLVSRPEITRPMTAEKFESIKPLLAACPYIEKVEMHKGQKIKHDFTGFRQCYERKHTLSEAQAAHICPQQAPDTKTAWLTALAPETHGRAVLARSARYHNPEWDLIWPDVLREYPDALFIGTREEYEAFSAEFGKVEYRPTPTFMDIANVIAGSSIFVGNQSSPYAVAEGLKHKSIQETCPTHRDCIFPRSNAKFILWRKEWEQVRRGGTTKLLLILQCHPGDVYQARELVKLICEIEPVIRTDVEFALAPRRDTNPHAIEDILKIAKTKFAVVHRFLCQRRGVGWPNGCNDLWQESMETVVKMLRAGKTQAEAVLTFEPDCLPLRPDWIDIAKAAWRKAHAQGKLCAGHAHNEPKTHINGNALFAADLLRTHRTIGDSEPRTGWDVTAGSLLLRIGMDTNAIYQLKRMKDVSREFIEGLRKNEAIPAFFHGIKSLQGIDIVREMIADGSFAARVQPQEEELTPMQALA